MIDQFRFSLILYLQDVVGSAERENVYIAHTHRNGVIKLTSKAMSHTKNSV